MKLHPKSHSLTRNINRIFAFLVVACFLLVHIGVAAEELSLLVGDQKVLKFPSLKRVSIANPGIADIKVIEGTNQILVTGKAEGTTNLIVWDMKDEKTSVLIKVLAKDPSAILKELGQMLGPIEGIQVKVVGDKVVIDGFVYKQNDFDRIEKVKELFGGQVISFVKLSPNVNKLVVEQINRALKEAGIKGAVARAEGASIFLEGSVASDKEGKKALEIASSISKDITNLLSVGIAYDNLIILDVKVIEVRTSAARKLGFNWPGQLGGTDLSSGNASGMAVSGAYNTTFVGNTENGAVANQDLASQFILSYQFPVIIDTLINDGIVRILSNPKLVCKSGGQAKWLVGGEFPVPVTNEDGGLRVEYKEYGIILDIQPKTDNADNIQTKIKVEVSDLDFSKMVGGFPSILKRNVDTEMNLRRGQTIALSGLLSNESGKNVSKFPVLGQIPILGEFFKTRNFSDTQTEVMIMVTPELTSSADPKNAKTLSEWRSRYQEATDDLKFSILD
jgi:pilus assembly protein CpaC